MPPFLADVLSWPENRVFVTAIKTARSYGVPPTVMIRLDRQPEEGWTRMDRALAMALQILEDETCSDCGNPLWIGHNDHQDIVFEIKSRVCYGCAAIESAQEKAVNKKSSRRVERGKKRFLARNDKYIPSRAEFYQAEHEKL